MDEILDNIIAYFDKLNALLKSSHLDVFASVVVNLIIITALFKAVEVFSQNLREHILAKDEKNQLVRFLPMMERTFKFLIVFFIVASFLQSHGYSVTSLITGFGISGLAVGMAANSTISSMFGTLSIFSDKAYKIGDYIIVNGVEGTVEDVNIRSTKLRSLDNYLHIVPNSSVATGNICNISAAKRRRFVETFGLVYETSDEMLEKAVHIVEEILKADEQVSNDYVVYVDSLSASSIDIKCIAYAKTRAYNEMLKIKSRVILEVVKRFRAEGLSFAFPSTSVYIEKNGN